jgi:hypothetical protein
MAQPRIGARPAAVEIRIEKQIEVVAKAVCDGRDFERPATILSHLTELLNRLRTKR